MDLKQFIEGCQKHNGKLADTMIDIYGDYRVGATTFIIISDRSDAGAPALFNLSTEELEHALNTIDDDTEIDEDLVTRMCESLDSQTECVTL